MDFSHSVNGDHQLRQSDCGFTKRLISTIVGNKSAELVDLDEGAMPVPFG